MWKLQGSFYRCKTTAAQTRWPIFMPDSSNSTDKSKDVPLWGLTENQFIKGSNFPLKIPKSHCFGLLRTHFPTCLSKGSTDKRQLRYASSDAVCDRKKDCHPVFLVSTDIMENGKQYIIPFFVFLTTKRSEKASDATIVFRFSHLSRSCVRNAKYGIRKTSGATIVFRIRSVRPLPIAFHYGRNVKSISVIIL
jgi:hypothetical protein